MFWGVSKVSTSESRFRGQTDSLTDVVCTAWKPCRICMTIMSIDPTRQPGLLWKGTCPNCSQCVELHRAASCATHAAAAMMMTSL